VHSNLHSCFVCFYSVVIPYQSASVAFSSEVSVNPSFNLTHPLFPFFLYASLLFSSVDLVIPYVYISSICSIPMTSCLTLFNTIYSTKPPNELQSCPHIICKYSLRSYKYVNHQTSSFSITVHRIWNIPQLKHEYIHKPKWNACVVKTTLSATSTTERL
jgi:hypothetical protein